MPESKSTAGARSAGKKPEPKPEPEPEAGKAGAAGEPRRPEPDSPPKRGRPRKTPLETRLADFLSVIAAGFVAAGDWHCGTLLADRAEPMAAAWGRLAKRNKRIAAMLETMLTGGEWGEVAIVTLTTVLPMAAHHGLVPERLGLLGALGPIGEEVDAPGGADPMAAARAAAGGADDGAPRPFAPPPQPGGNGNGGE